MFIFWQSMFKHHDALWFAFFSAILSSISIKTFFIIRSFNISQP